MTSSRYLVTGASIFLATTIGTCSGFVAPLSRVTASSSTTPVPFHLPTVNLVAPSADSVDIMVGSISTLLSDAGQHLPESGEISYSKYSYYTVLGLYLLSFPGLWSTIKRSTKAKVKRKTYVT